MNGPGEAPIVCFDYAFLSDKEDIVDEAAFEAAGDGAVTVLVVRDDKSKSMFGHVVPRKGLDEKGFPVKCGWARLPFAGCSVDSGAVGPGRVRRLPEVPIVRD